MALSLHMPADGAPDVGVDGGLCRLLRVDQNDRKREEHGNFTKMGAFRLHTFQSARNGGRSVDARERRRRNGFERRHIKVVKIAREVNAADSLACFSATNILRDHMRLVNCELIDNQEHVLVGVSFRLHTQQ